MKVFQIIIGELPEPLVSAVASVKTWADRHGYEYIQVTEVPLQYKDMPNIRVISNYMRVDLLAEESNRIYMDWDVVLQDDFNLELGDKILVDKMGDQVMYNANHCEEFKKMREYMTPIRKFELGVIFNGFCAGVIDRDKFGIIDSAGWEHLNWSQIR
jgi:hypothetical protein